MTLLRSSRKDATVLGDGEAAQAGCVGGDGDGQVEGKEGFAGLRFTADDPDRFRTAREIAPILRSLSRFWRRFFDPLPWYKRPENRRLSGAEYEV
jgi:hypothetical protein